MPSVRIRRPKSSYTVLSDDTNTPRNLATIFSPNTQSVDDDRQLHANVSAGNSPLISNYTPVELSPLATGGRRASRSPIRTRPRSGSRILTHVLSQRFVRPPTPEGDRQPSPEPRSSLSPPRLSAHNGMVELEGSQADIWVRSDKPAIIGSALSVPQSNGSRRSIMEMLEDEHHHDDIVDHLDCVDPQVATLSNLTNAANSILIPPLSFYSRKPVVYLSSRDDNEGDVETGQSQKRQYEDSVDRHVDDVLKRPSKFRRTMQGVWSFLKTPMGIIAGIYGFLVVFWGAAIVIFLAKIINLHNANTQGFWIEVSSQVENGLFTVTGIGLLPSRVLDTYRIYKIWHYKRKTKLLRAKAGLPQLYDIDDLPDPAYDPNYVHVLSDQEQKDLHKQQEKFQHHQTWYRAHGTETHRAFPINTALLICCLNDGNSIFQIMLCATMWGLNRFQRPPWSTGTLIPASFLCGILSGVFIWKGGQKTKRSAKVEEKLRAVLAMDFDDDIIVEEVEPEMEDHAEGS